MNCPHQQTGFGLAKQAAVLYVAPCLHTVKRRSSTRWHASAVQQSYSIRGIAPSDVPKLALIEQQCKEFAACWSAADIAAELDNSLSRAAVAADVSTDEPLGYIVCWLIAGELQVGVLSAAGSAAPSAAAMSVACITPHWL